MQRDNDQFVNNWIKIDETLERLNLDNCVMILDNLYTSTDKELSDKLVKYLFAPRNAIDPAEAYRLFRGRDAEISAFAKKQFEKQNESIAQRSVPNWSQFGS